MNNEPVAWGWMYEDGQIYDVICPEEHARAEGDYTIPLFTQQSLDEAFEAGRQQGMQVGMLQERTMWELAISTKEIDESFDRTASHMAGEYVSHPAKTLTDARVTYLAKRFEGVWSGEVDYKGFAGAILKEVSEK